VTNAGGPGVMATDTLIANRGKLATPSESTMARLNAFLPESWSHGNPVDVLGDAPPERFGKAVDLVLEDDQVDAVLTILTPQAMTDPTATAIKVAAVAEKAHKPLLAAWIGGRRMRDGDRLLSESGVATYPTPEAAVRAFMHLVSYSRNLETLYETPRDVPVRFSLNAPLIHERLEKLAPAEGTVLSEADSKSLLESYGIPVSKAIPATTADEAALAAGGVGYPVVLKVLSPQITHKTDVGGVALNIRNEQGLRTAFADIVRLAREKRPDADILGVTVQQMLDSREGVELIVGMKTDATFGAVMLVGAGGITAELFRDRALGLPPLNERLARRMLESLLSWPLLQGYRGRPGVNIEQLVEVLMRLSYLTAHHPEIREFDVNPLLATSRDAVALDARIVVERRPTARAYSHLAIRPYPEEYVQRDVLSDGQAITFRPVRPEDEPAWLDMVARCSPETLHARFRAFFKEPTHEIATRYCVLDYDRELAIMAEVDGGAFIGVGRLIADANHESAEFALLVVDACQNKGLGLRLTAYCLKVAAQWGVRRIVAETDLDNARMISIFEQVGFRVDRRFSERTAVVDKTIVP
jgi:acetyltransferase